MKEKKRFLNLRNPFIFFDFESNQETGTHQVISVLLIKLVMIAWICP